VSLRGDLCQRHEHHLDLAPNTVARLVTTGGFINPASTCATSHMGLQTTGAGGGAGVAVPVKLTSLTLQNCVTTNPAGCSSTFTVGSLANSTGSASYTSTSNGTITLHAPTMSHTCPLGSGSVTCSYGSNHVHGTIGGGSPAHVTFTNQALSSTSGGFCPTDATWTATYRATTPHALFVTNS
jgi:hypothetical protein